MNANPNVRQSLDRGPHIDGASAEPIQLGDDEHVRIFQTIYQLREFLPLECWNRPADRFADDPLLCY
ncbi:unnamed protein product [Burkholderia pseudomallei]|nr:unnamed protein product [Burkholderia pseudomallei]